MNKVVKVAVIQITRIGDLIQTAQAVRQFRAENQAVHITLIARRKFAKGIDFLLDLAAYWQPFQRESVFPNSGSVGSVTSAHSVLALSGLWRWVLRSVVVRPRPTRRAHESRCQEGS